MSRLDKSHFLGKRQYICFLLFYVSVFSYMPTTLKNDQIIWSFATILLLVSTMVDFLRSRVRIYIPKSYTMYCVLIMLGIASMIWSKENIYTLHYIISKFPIISIGVLCTVAYLRDEKTIDKVLVLICMAACFAAIRFCIYTPWDNYLRGKFGILLDINTNYNNYTSPLSIAFIISSYYALIRKKKLMFIPTTFLAVVLVVAGSKKTIIMIPVVVFVYIINQGNWKDYLKLSFFSLVSIIVLIYVIWNFELLVGIKNSLINLYTGLILKQEMGIESSTGGRLYLIKEALRVWSVNPILGVGWNNFRYYNTLGLYSHNNYAELLSCLGILGFLIYYLIHFTSLFPVIVKSSNTIYRKLILCMICGMLLLEMGALPIYSREVMLIYLVTVSVNNGRVTVVRCRL